MEKFSESNKKRNGKRKVKEKDRNTDEKWQSTCNSLYFINRLCVFKGVYIIL